MCHGCNDSGNASIVSAAPGLRFGGAVLERVAIDIGGTAVDLKTAIFWEQLSWLIPWSEPLMRDNQLSSRL
jgi:hypothetical protein